MWWLNLFGGRAGEITKQADISGLTLSASDVGKTYTLIKFSGGDSFRDKLYAIGLNPGISFKVLINSGRGPIELEVRRNKLAIGRGMADKIIIKEYVDR